MVSGGAGCGVRLNIPPKTQKMLHSQGHLENDKRVLCFTTGKEGHTVSTPRQRLFSFYFLLSLLKGTKLMIYLRESG